MTAISNAVSSTSTSDDGSSTTSGDGNGDTTARRRATATKPVILVLVSGGGIDVSAQASSDVISSILWIGYPGQAGGRALAQVLFGDVSPSARLPTTWYLDTYTKQVSSTHGLVPPHSLHFASSIHLRFFAGINAGFPHAPTRPFSSRSWQTAVVKPWQGLPLFQRLCRLPGTQDICCRIVMCKH